MGEVLYLTHSHSHSHKKKKGKKENANYGMPGRSPFRYTNESTEFFFGEGRWVGEGGGDEM